MSVTEFVQAASGSSAQAAKTQRVAVSQLMPMPLELEAIVLLQTAYNLNAINDRLGPFQVDAAVSECTPAC